MHAITTKPELEPSTTPKPAPTPQCKQCGERVETTAPPRETPRLCADCACDDLPCTD